MWREPSFGVKQGGKPYFGIQHVVLPELLKEIQRHEVKLLFSYIAKRDSHTLLFMGCLMVNLPQAAFAMMSFGMFAMLISHARFMLDHYVRVQPLASPTGEHALVEGQS